MEKIFTIGLISNSGSMNYDYPKLPAPQSDVDTDIHDYIVEQLLNRDFTALIILFSKENIVLAMKLSLHIRLTEALHVKRLCKIIMVSDMLLDTVIRDAKSYGHILATKGAKYLQNPTPGVLAAATDKLKPLAADEFKNDLLKQILILPDETTGRHSIANIWGAIKMEQAAGLNILQNNPEVSNKSKGLYFKYLVAQNYNYKKLITDNLRVLGKINLNKPKKIEATDKKILIIDDEASKGWGELFKNLFVTNNPENIEIIDERASGFEDFSPHAQNLIQHGNFDLFLLDLRLMGSEEENILKTEDFSGFKVLKKIKSFNEGNQVIIFTASNKTWNLKNLTENGADGYYLKESPEYSFADDIAKESYLAFCQSIEEALSLSHLRLYRSQINALKNKKHKNQNEDFREFAQKSAQQLETVFKILKLNRNQDPVLLRSAYLLIYQIIEDFCRLKSIYNSAQQCVTMPGGETLQIFKDSEDGVVSALTFIQETTKRNKKPKLVSIEKQSCIISGNELSVLSKIQSSMPFKFAAIGYFYLGVNKTIIDDFIRLNEIRNDIAHGHNSIPINQNNLDELFSLVKIILDD